MEKENKKMNFKINNKLEFDDKNWRELIFYGSPHLEC